MKHASIDPAARILVIEDNGSDVFLLNRALKKQELRFELIHLMDGASALAFVRKQGTYANAAIPDLILLDLNLSKYTGEDILRRSGAPITSTPFRYVSGALPGPVWTKHCSRISGSPASSPSPPDWTNLWRSARQSKTCWLLRGQLDSAVRQQKGSGGVW